MSDFDIMRPAVELPEQEPEPQIPEDELFFTDEEQDLIEQYCDQYPTREAAVMKALWLAQEKFGFLPPEVIRLTAGALDLPYTLVYGVATFYTQYYKEEKGQFVLDVCCCFSCQFMGGYDVLRYLEEKLDIHRGETTEDGLFTIQEVECLGCCGSAPMMQISNKRYVHNVDEDKVDRLIEDLRNGEMPSFTSVTLPQDEDEMGGNRRTDVTEEQIETYQPPRDYEYTE
jgi:NADH-quinone oxidoreductase subunit E